MKNALFPICCTLAIAVLPISSSWAEKPAICNLKVKLPSAPYADFNFNPEKPGEKNGYVCELKDYQNSLGEYSMECKYQNSSITAGARGSAQKVFFLATTSTPSTQYSNGVAYSYLVSTCGNPFSEEKNQLNNPFQ